MEPDIYDKLVVQEKVHWWWLGRRKILLSLLKTLKLGPASKILDAGCGSGGNLGMLSQLGGDLYAFELYDKARLNAQALGLAKIDKGALPGDIPFPGTSFDLIALIDVLEHVEDDKGALAALAARLAPGGVLCINVPAFQWLYARHDEMHHHFRRYGKKELVRMVEEAGLKIEYSNFWNFFLFPAAILARMVDLVGYKKGNLTIGAKIPPALLNSFFYRVVASERLFLPYIRVPFGLSIVILARKPQ